MSVTVIVGGQFASEVENSIGACINYIGFNPISLKGRNSYK